MWLNINYYREQKGITWNTIGELIGDKNIHQHFCKKDNITFDKLITISYVLNVSDLVLLVEDFDLK